MSDRFSLRIEIGGKVLESWVSELIEHLKSLDAEVEGHQTKGHGIQIPETAEALKVAAAGSGKVLVVCDYEGSHSDFEYLSRFCFANKLAYDFTCDAKYEYPGSFEFWRPGMDQPFVYGYNNDGQLNVSATEIRYLLMAYIISGAERCRLLDEQAPAVPELEPFEIVEDQDEP